MDTREAIFEYIVDYMTKHSGHSPSLRQIMEHCELSTKSLVAFHLNKLEDEGRITRTGRNIYVPGARWEWDREE